MCALYEITKHTLGDEVRRCIFGVGLFCLSALHKLQITPVNMLSLCSNIFWLCSNLLEVFLG